MPLRGVDEFKRTMKRSEAQFANWQQQTADVAARAVVAVDEATPVVTGNLRSNWQLLNRLNSRYSRGRHARGYRRNSRNINLSYVARYRRERQPSTRLYLFNNTVYARSVERRRGFMRRAFARINKNQR